MIDFGTLENHRVITQSLNHAEWDLVRVFVRKLDSNDIWMRFGRPLDLQQDVILKQFFDSSEPEPEKSSGRQTNTVRSQVSCTVFVYRLQRQRSVWSSVPT